MTSPATTPLVVTTAGKAADELCCSLCRSQSCAPWLQKGEYSLYRCDDCGTGFVWPIPEAAALAAVYMQGYLEKGGQFGPQDSAKRLARQKAVQTRDRLALLRAFSYRGKSALDFGCGDGWWLDGLGRGYELRRGIEASKSARQRCNEKFGEGSVVPDLDALPGGESYDLITLFDALEHVPCPLELLRKLKARMREGAFLMIVVPVADNWTARLVPERWDQIRPPEHLHYFTRDSLSKALTLQGLELLAMRGCWPRWPKALPYLPNWLQAPFRLPMKLLARYSSTIEHGICDSVLVLAKRRGA